MKKPRKERRTIKGKGNKFIKLLLHRREPFEARYTGSTTKVETEDEIVTYSSNFLKFKSLGFIGRVKSYVRNLAPETHPMQPYESRHIKYFKFNRISNGEYDRVVEIDVNEAFWKIAFETGYISEDLYNEGKEVDKKTRLVALGAWATQYKYFDYNGEGEPKLREPESTDEEKRVRSYFFHVAYQLGEVMNDVFGSTDGMLWYWFDAFFVDSLQSSIVVQKMESAGLPVKFKEIDKITVHQGEGGKEFRCYMKGEPFGYKPFFMPDKGRHEYLIKEAIYLHESSE